LPMMRAGEKMVGWCEHGSVSLVSPGNHGGIYAELTRAQRIAGAFG
jgi:hypothetical protein